MPEGTGTDALGHLSLDQGQPHNGASVVPSVEPASLGDDQGPDCANERDSGTVSLLQARLSALRKSQETENSSVVPTATSASRRYRSQINLGRTAIKASAAQKAALTYASARANLPVAVPLSAQDSRNNTASFLMAALAANHAGDVSKPPVHHPAAGVAFIHHQPFAEMMRRQMSPSPGLIPVSPLSGCLSLSLHNRLQCANIPPDRLQVPAPSWASQLTHGNDSRKRHVRAQPEFRRPPPTSRTRLGQAEGIPGTASTCIFTRKTNF